jgi:hypothetical protein
MKYVTTSSSTGTSRAAMLVLYLTASHVLLFTKKSVGAFVQITFFLEQADIYFCTDHEFLSLYDVHRLSPLQGIPANTVFLSKKSHIFRSAAKGLRLRLGGFPHHSFQAGVKGIEVHRNAVVRVDQAAVFLVKDYIANPDHNR